MNPRNIHGIDFLTDTLWYYAYDEKVVRPTPAPQSVQFNDVSYPGGPAIGQIVSGMTPNGTLTIHVIHGETDYHYEITRELSSDGSWSEEYYPSLTKEKGTYYWWAEDNNGNKTSMIPYVISDSESPEPIFGFKGDEIVDTTPPPPECLPDFVAKRAWITKSENGEDKYVFEVGDTPWINVKVKNEGCANSPQDISVWYLLSKGEKEDNHHDWVKIGTDTIRDYELAVGQDKWEKEEFTVPNEPGKYNIVACADRIALYDNGEGAVPEEHKANDCSTEAVFTVLPKNNPPVGYFDNATCDSLDGWAKDPDTSSSVFIRFYKDGPADTGTYIGSTFADIERSDLSYDDKNHGFSFALPDALNDGTEHQVYAYAIDDAGGTNTLLTNSPKTVKCGLTPDQLAAVMSVIQNVLFEDDTQPDLTVISPSASKTALAPSESFTFSATVKNSGTASAAASTLRWYRSTDSAISTSDTQLTNKSVSALNANQTSALSASLTAPAAAGTYWIGACVDAVSGEASTTNNCSAGVQITVAATAKPDLTVISPSASKTALAPSESFTFSATVKNSGTASAAASTLRWYQSTDSVISTSDTQLTNKSVAALNAGQTSALSASLTAPAAAGTYWIGACVDAVSGEASTTNNCSSGIQITVTSSPTAPDLTVINPSASKTSLAPSESFTFSATVKNSGTASAAASTLRWYQSTDSAISTSDTQLTNKSVAALNANQTSALSASLTAPAATGTYWIGACVDAVSGESSTTNNCSAGVQITVATTAKPDLTVIGITSPATFEAGKAFSITTQFRNQGTANATQTTANVFYMDIAEQTTSDPVHQENIPALAINQTISRTMSINAPCKAGEYLLGVCINPGDNLESDDDNNCDLNSFTVTGECKSSFLPAIELLLK